MLEGFLEGRCLVVVAASLLLRFVAWFSILELFRVATGGEAETEVLLPLGGAKLIFEVLVLFDGASITASLFLFLLAAARPPFPNPFSTGGSSEMDGSGGDIPRSSTWAVGGIAGESRRERAGEIGDGCGGESGTEGLTWARVGEK